MPLNQLITFCHQNYNRPNRCADCPNADCQGSCNACLQDIHHGTPRMYDCHNMLNCYTCSYIFKYASEIGHLFNLIQYNGYTDFNILSLGCGSCADLFGIDNFLRVHQRNLPISYYGVDINARWNLTHQQIIGIFPGHNINFEIANVFDFLTNVPDDQELNYNIVVMQYLLNEIYKNDYERLEEFTDLFVQKIINNLPINTTVIINDINLNTVRGIATRIFNAAGENNEVAQYQYRFHQPTSHTYGGVMHANDNLLFNVPQEIYANYDVKLPCSSYQMVIHKTGNR
ncbi:hypothetical protein [Draconibacterium orientale]|uniref:hypothetical protein n=1 Tax=Draconibacterium orientale TaxID=1168034 RepID=UPI002A0A3BDD|nr:hypothetical protein [Draconibacterium orientale]